MRINTKHTYKPTGGPRVWYWNACPDLPDKKWEQVQELLQHHEFELVFTTRPQAPAGKLIDTRCQRGGRHGVKWNAGGYSVDKEWEYLGETWCGTGFEQDMISREPRDTVKAKVEKICKKVKMDIMRGYVEEIGKMNGSVNSPQVTSGTGTSILPSSADSSKSAESAKPIKMKDWTEEEEKLAQAAWDEDEAANPKLDYSVYTYRLGKLTKLPPRSSGITDPFVLDYDAHGGWEDPTPWA